MFRRAKIALANYTDLQAAVTSWLNRNDSQIPITDFIDIAEAELNARVRIRNNMTIANLTMVIGVNYLALPSDFLEEVELNYASSTDELSRLPFSDVDRARGAGNSGRPCAYALAGSPIIFDCAPDAAYTLTLRYYKAWDIAADTTNWLLTNHPDAYLFGALLEANAWLGDMNQAAYCRERRDAAVQRALTADSRSRGGVLRTDAALLGAGRYNILTDI